MITWRPGRLGAIASSLLLLSACATTRMSSGPFLQTSQLPERLQLAGYSVTPPVGPWVALPPAGDAFETAVRNGGRPPAVTQVLAGHVLFGRRAETSVFAGVVTFDARGFTGRTPEEFHAWREQELRGKRDPRFTLVELSVAPDLSRSASCVRFASLEEDRGVPASPGVLHRIRVRGVSCLHPQWPEYLIEAAYSQRYRHDVPPVDVTAEGEPFLRSLELTPERPIFAEAVPFSTHPYQLAISDEAVWVTHLAGATVSRVDIRTRRAAASVPVGTRPVGIAAGENAVWVVNESDDTVSRIDPQAARVVATIRVGRHPAFVATGFGAVWVTNYSSGTVSRIDPGTNTVVATIPVGLGAVGLAVAEGSVWVASRAREAVARIDPASNRLVGGGIALPGMKPNFVAVAQDRLWVTTEQGYVVQIDPRTSTKGNLTVIAGEQLGQIAVGHGALWVLSDTTGTVWRIDPASGNVIGKPLALGGWPLALGLGPDGVWLTDAHTRALRLYRP